ncbi:hypothetical protein K501DRAFT_276227 [Backusella circina FSU 941]|nr:hypothetical protein K501DRAFT_276227 [Backusella circina FSU 941]
MVVCRNWCRVLDRCSLFYSFNLYENNDQFNRFINMFKQSPDRAAQVEEFYILFDILPNIRVIESELCWGSEHSDYDDFIKPTDIVCLESKVEFLSDSNYCELTYQMLYSDLGGRLKTLCLNLFGVPSTATVLYELDDLPVFKQALHWVTHN